VLDARSRYKRRTVSTGIFPVSAMKTVRDLDDWRAVEAEREADQRPVRTRIISACRGPREDIRRIERESLAPSAPRQPMRVSRGPTRSFGCRVEKPHLLRGGGDGFSIARPRPGCGLIEVVVKGEAGGSSPNRPPQVLS